MPRKAKANVSRKLPADERARLLNNARQKRWRAKDKKDRERAAHLTVVADTMVKRQQVEASRRAATLRAEARLATTMKLYMLFLIDPPWDDGADSYSEKGKGRAAANHYSTRTPAQMRAAYPTLPAAPDALMYMWTTSQYLAEAIKLMEFWGFTYGGIAVWDKVIIGKGRRHRIQAEFLIYGSKGKGLPIPNNADKTPNIFRERVVRGPGIHSVKPDKVANDLARQYPGTEGRRLEMFARRPRMGWDTHGNEGLEEIAEAAD
jgi:N6-adenosine-specific RNA methylase IME4